MEGGKGGAGGDALVLANPITKRVAKVEGASVGGSERDVDGAIEGEVGGMLEARLVFLADVLGDGDCCLEA